MPNWCYNRLEVQGTEKDMSEFYTLFRVNDHRTCEEFKMDWFVPRPEHEEENWYDWNILNWGTKWDVYELTEMFPNLDMEMEYEEPGMAFCGIVYYSDGKINHSHGEIIQVSDCCEKEVDWDDDYESSCSKCGQECESQDEHSYH